jgi:NADH-quinone oxidoreductase subunit L
MVAAGVYLVGRMYSLISMSPEALLIISIVGCITAVFAASIAFTRTDIKQVLAYSTISQLGFMFTALGVGSNIAWQAGLFHLTTHAFFKACLFLGSGSVIHGCHHEQDMTRMGGLMKKMPITGATYGIACASIAGFPFLTAGFYSKDMILQALWLGNGEYDAAYKVIFVILAFAAGMTAAYMFRSFWLTFYTKPRDHHLHDHAHESPWTILTALVVLATLAVVAGFWWPNVLLPNGADSPLATFAKVYDGHAEGSPDYDLVHGAHMIAMYTSFLVAGVGMFLGWFWYQTAKGEVLRKRMRAAIGPMYSLCKNKYYIDEIVQYGLINTFKLGGALMAWFDSTVLDQIVVDGAGRTTVLAGDVSGVADDAIVDGAVQGAAGAAWGVGGLFSRFQSGRVRNYLFGAVGTAALFAFLVLYASRS